jgi:hypothetical protein
MRPRRWLPLLRRQASRRSPGAARAAPGLPLSQAEPAVQRVALLMALTAVMRDLTLVQAVALRTQVPNFARA